MQINSKKDLRKQRIGRLLKINLKKRKIFQKKIKKNNKWAFYQIVGLKKSIKKIELKENSMVLKSRNIFDKLRKINNKSFIINKWYFQY